MTQSPIVLTTPVGALLPTTYVSEIKMGPFALNTSQRGIPREEVRQHFRHSHRQQRLPRAVCQPARIIFCTPLPRRSTRRRSRCCSTCIQEPVNRRFITRTQKGNSERGTSCLKLPPLHDPQARVDLSAGRAREETCALSSVCLGSASVERVTLLPNECCKALCLGQSIAQSPAWHSIQLLFVCTRIS